MKIKFLCLIDADCNDWGGKNYILRYHISEISKEEEEKILNYLAEHNIVQTQDSEVEFYFSYDNMDYNGLFAEVYYVDKENILKDNSSEEYEDTVEFFVWSVNEAIEIMIES